MTHSQQQVHDWIMERAAEIDMAACPDALSSAIEASWDDNISRFDNLYSIVEDFGQHWHKKFWAPKSF